MLRRIYNLLVASIALPLLSPFFLIIAALVKLDSRGPAIFRQKRVGLNNKDFTLYKFRTMVTGPDQKLNLTVGGRDPRITRVGYYLRKYKLDELPQLWNVLTGDMNFVGPRPEVREYVNLYTPEQMKVLSVKPGITDLASIKFSDESNMLKQHEKPEEVYIKDIMQQKLALNMEYINNPTFLHELKIIFQTFWAILKKIGS